MDTGAKLVFTITKQGTVNLVIIPYHDGMSRAHVQTELELTHAGATISYLGAVDEITIL